MHDFALAPAAPGETTAETDQTGVDASAGGADAKAGFYNGLSDDFGRAADGDESADVQPDEDQPAPSYRPRPEVGVPPPYPDELVEDRPPLEEDGAPPGGPADDHP